MSFSIWSLLLWEPQKFKMAARGSQNGRWSLETGLPLAFRALSATFSKYIFWSKHSFYEKSRRREKKEKKKEKKIMLFLVFFVMIGSVNTANCKSRRRSVYFYVLIGETGTGLDNWNWWLIFWNRAPQLLMIWNILQQLSHLCLHMNYSVWPPISPFLYCYYMH